MENTTQESDQRIQEKEMNMTDRFITAMFLPKEYEKLLRLSAGKLVGFVALLILLVTVIRYAVPTLGAIAGMGGVKNIIMNEVPDFKLENGVFTLGERLERTDEINGIYMVVDTSVDKYTSEDVPPNMIEAIMVSKSNMLVYNQVAGVSEMLQDSPFSDFQGITLSNKIVAGQSHVIYFCLGIILVMMYFVEVIKYIGAGLFYAILMNLMVRAMMVETTFGEVYRMSLYAQAVGVIVNAVMCCINIPILVLAGGSFSMLITIMIMNRAFMQIKMKSEIL
ncbi:MAG: DUF1189 domain-containing protein [Lachnospiraceae bacterium]|nr:DUF1189 domain-containing protein [Lachnospiraceae bacterium]